MALAAMPETDRLGSDSEFKPNLVNTVCYIVQAVVQVCVWVGGGAGEVEGEGEGEGAGEEGPKEVVAYRCP